VPTLRLKLDKCYSKMVFSWLLLPNLPFILMRHHFWQIIYSNTCNQHLKSSAISLFFKKHMSRQGMISKSILKRSTCKNILKSDNSMKRLNKIYVLQPEELFRKFKILNQKKFHKERQEKRKFKILAWDPIFSACQNKSQNHLKNNLNIFKSIPHTSFLL